MHLETWFLGYAHTHREIIISFVIAAYAFLPVKKVGLLLADPLIGWQRLLRTRQWLERRLKLEICLWQFLGFYNQRRLFSRAALTFLLTSLRTERV